MRILRLQGYHPHTAVWEARIAATVAAAPELADAGWETQQDALAQLGHPAVDGFAAALRDRGHDAHDLQFKLPHVRRAFLTEHDLSPALVDDAAGFLRAVVDVIHPDVILERDHGLLRSVGIARLRREFPSVSRVLLHHAVPHLDATVAEADGVLVVCPAYRPAYTAAGARRVDVLANAFYAPALPHVRTGPRDLPLTFSGRSGFGGGSGKWSRYEHLHELMTRTPLECWLGDDDKATVLGVSPVAVRSRTRTVLARLLRRDVGSPRTGAPDGHDDPTGNGPGRTPPAAWRPPLRPLGARFPGRVHPGVHGLDMLALLARSRVAFNRGPDREGDCSGTFRIFEATAMGAALLTERTSDLGDHFAIGEEVVAYRDVDDCVAAARDLLHDEDRCAAIAEAGRRRTLRDHTWAGRAAEVERLLSA